MPKLKDKTTIKINGFPIYIEHFDSMMIIKDDYENRMEILVKIIEIDKILHSNIC